MRPTTPVTRRWAVLVSVLQTDCSYGPGSVHAVVQGDRAFLRVRISWPDDSP